MKAEVFSARAIALSCAVAIDMARATGSADWEARAALADADHQGLWHRYRLRVADMGIQVHGGMGFIEETGAAQYLRDVRVTAIYEGTNGIQAMDLVGRKMMDDGEAAFRLIEEIEQNADAVRGQYPNMATAVWNAAESLREATEWLVAQDMNDRFAGAVPYLRAFARVLGSHYHLRAAMAEGGMAPAPPWRAWRSSGCCPNMPPCWRRCAKGPQGFMRCRMRIWARDQARASATPFETPPAEGAAIEVAPGVFWMRLPLPMALDHVNIYALDDGDGWTVIDTGFDSKRGRALWARLLAGPLAGQPVKRVVVTHHHPDHVGLAGWFQGQGAELVTTRTAWLFARMLVLDEQPLPTPESMAFYRGAGMDAAMLAKRSHERPFNFADVVAPLPLGFTRIAEGSQITMGGRRWLVRIGNGHAPEHATFWSMDDNLVLGGDQLLPSISANIGVYPTEPDADPLGEWLESCRAFQAHAHDDQLILPGHKLPFTGLPLRLVQMIENHHCALTRLRDHLAEPRSAAQCFAPLFKRQIDEGTYGLALVEAVAHLNHLLQRGDVQRSMGADGVWMWRAT